MSKTKSKLGARASICEPPPHANGRPWYTSPPSYIPLPKHVEYAKAFRAELVANKTKRNQYRTDQALRLVRIWLKEANRKLTRVEQFGQPPTMDRLDDLLVHASIVMGQMAKELGVDRWRPEWEPVVQRVKARALRRMYELTSQGRHVELRAQRAKDG